MTQQVQVKITMFSGGRGTASLADALIQHPQIDLTLLVNAYDDGLSTGRIRQFVPGILGPSDVRKNISRLIPSKEESQRALKFVLEYRLPESVQSDSVERALATLFESSSGIFSAEFSAQLLKLRLETVRSIQTDIGHFLAHARASSQAFDYADCSFGNLVFAGHFLRCDKDFNATIKSFQDFAQSKGQVYNVTRGEPLVLVALKEDGVFLKNESEIVSKQDATRIADIFLLKNYLSTAEESELLSLEPPERSAYLAVRSQTPELGPDALRAIQESDLIIYGPGTQHSSLFPSYLTSGLSEAIASNTSAEKIFISNIRKDYEIQGETSNSLAQKLVYYMNRRGTLSFQPSQLITTYFVQTPTLEKDAASYVRFDPQEFAGSPSDLRLGNWEEKKGAHSGGQILEELVAIVNARAQKSLKAFPYMVSIVVPGLDEEKTVSRVLHDLVLLDFNELGIAKEIIFVDGGSKDRTFEFAQKEPGVQAYALERGCGRGDALRFGAEKARGNIIAFFPCDAEYETRDLVTLVGQIAAGEYRAVFGSRAIKCVDFGARLKEIYRGDSLGAWISKWGGMSLSILSLFLYNRFLSDPLTGLKVFQAQLLRKMKLQAHGVELETEIVAKLSRLGEFVLEVPVAFHPRRRSEGKKVTLWDGIKTLLNLIRWRFATYENRIYRHSGV